MGEALFYVGFYIVETLPVFIIARRCGHEYAWLAFVPLANLWLMCDMADMNVWFLLILLLPYVNILFLAVVWWRIAENTNKRGWIGLLMIVPLLNLLVWYYIAFVDTGRFVE